MAKFFLIIDGDAGGVVIPLREDGTALVADNASCGNPRCAATDKPPLRVRLALPRRDPADPDRAYLYDGGCEACACGCGRVREEAATLFGIEEDERVLRGRPRVY